MNAVAQRSEDCLGELELSIADANRPGTHIAYATLTCYGRWNKGYPATHLEPGEVRGYEFTRLSLTFAGGHEVDVTNIEQIAEFAAPNLGD